MFRIIYINNRRTFLGKYGLLFSYQYEDELLYSVFSRYHIYSGDNTTRDTTYELFGKRSLTQSTFFPHNIQALFNNIPSGVGVTIDDLIKNHTLYTFYTAFLPKERRTKIYRILKGDYSGNIYGSSGIMSSTIKVPVYLRYCPKCFSEDTIKYGEAYWHRIHQIPFVLICPSHGEILVNSNVSSRSPFIGYFTANDYSCKPNEGKEVFEPDIYNKLYILAKDVGWLLKHHHFDCAESLTKKYISLLIKKGLANSNYKVRQKQLHQEFIKYYGPSFLKLVDSYADSYNESWLKTILWANNSYSHPIRHILLIEFLCGSLERFSKENGEYKPFGNGPWPCLNKVADHFLKQGLKK